MKSISLEKKRKSNVGECKGIVTSTGGLSTEFGLSELDELIGHGPSTSRVNVPSSEGTSVGTELSPREELAAHGNFPTPH